MYLHQQQELLRFTNSVATKSESILLVNTDTGQTVYEKEADTKRYPASTTKIMTYIVVIENVDDIENTRVTIKKDVLDKLKGTEVLLPTLRLISEKQCLLKIYFTV